MSNRLIPFSEIDLSKCNKIKYKNSYYIIITTKTKSILPKHHKEAKHPPKPKQPQKK